MRRIVCIAGRVCLGILWVATLIGAFYAPVLSRQARFYPPHLARYAPGTIVVPNLDDLPAATPAPASMKVDQPQALTLAGGVLVDLAHNNNLELTDLSRLLGRAAARGARVIYAEGADAFLGQLRTAQALIVVTPEKPYADEELDAVRQFVARGGKVLLIAEPTKTRVYYQPRPDQGADEVILSDTRYLNRVAGLFGAFFSDDYLYNLETNDGHFRRPILTQFAADPLTEGLRAVAFQTAHSIQGAAQPMMWGDATTFSSRRPAAERLSPVGLAERGSVLLLGDLTCLNEAAGARHDNDQFVSNVADFLARSGRPDDLRAFPAYFGSRISLVYLQPDRADLSNKALAAGGVLQRFLGQNGRSLTLVGQAPADADAILLGRYEQAGAADARGILESQGVVLSVSESVASLLRQLNQSSLGSQAGSGSVNRAWIADYLNRYGGTQGAIMLEEAGGIGMAYTGLFVLDRREKATSLLILASSDEGLVEMVGRLTLGQIEDCFTQRKVTICPSYLQFGAPSEPASMPTPAATTTPVPSPAATPTPGK
jgi:hypothetical protein